MERLEKLRKGTKKHKFHFGGLINRFTQGETSIIEKGKPVECDVCGVMPGKEGHNCPLQSGKWIPNKSTERIVSPAAIVPLSQEELRFEEGGTYDYEDRKLYCYEKLSKGSEVIYKHNNGDTEIYKVHNKKNYSDYDDGLYIYLIKRGDKD